MQNGQWKPTDPQYAVDIPDPDPETPDIVKYCDGDGYTPIPQVQIGFRWPLSSDDGIETDVTDSSRWDLTSLRLSSDHHTQDPDTDQDHGVTGHIDFMSGWNTDKIQSLMETCYWDAGVGAPQNCGFVNTYENEN